MSEPVSAGAPATGHHGRHRGPRRRAAPARTGLLGASAALAVGAVAVSSGLIPGPDGVFTVGDPGSGGRVQADGAGDPTPYGGTSSSSDERASRSADRDALRDGSASPSGSSSSPEEKREKDRTSASPTESAEPSPPDSPSATGSTGDGDTKGSGTTDGSGGGGGGGGSATPTRTKSAGGGGAGSGSSSPETAAEQQVLSLVNAERAKAGCSPLTYDTQLAGLAESHSEDMARRGYFSHTTPDGESPWDRAAAAGVEHMGGENIARGQADAEAVMESWMNSEGHRANILNCDFRTLGVGAHFAEGGPWWTQAFGY